MQTSEANELAEHLDRTARQRAALMAFLTKLLKEQDYGLSLRNVKVATAHLFTSMIEEDHMVGDGVDESTLESVITFLREEELLSQFQNPK
jgi:hypothetical protein